MEKRHHIRERAHKIWIERGRPEGCDMEFWLAAERELETTIGSVIEPEQALAIIDGVVEGKLAVDELATIYGAFRRPGLR